MKIDFTLSIGYTRVRQAGVTADRWEARLDSLGLILVGAVVVLIILLILVPRILQGIASL